MANNSEYFRTQLEAQARGREHSQHIGEYAQMCKMMIEESVPILIEQYTIASALYDLRSDIQKLHAAHIRECIREAKA